MEFVSVPDPSQNSSGMRCVGVPIPTGIPWEQDHECLRSRLEFLGNGMCECPSPAQNSVKSHLEFPWEWDCECPTWNSSGMGVAPGLLGVFEKGGTAGAGGV